MAITSLPMKIFRCIKKENVGNHEWTGYYGTPMFGGLMVDPGHHGDPGSPRRSRVTMAIPGHHGDPGSPRRSRVTTVIPCHHDDPGSPW